jgi:transposase-like protein
MFHLVDPELQDLVANEGDDGYRLYLEGLRWPDGPTCPRCRSTRLLWLEKRLRYHCYGCRYQFRVTAGTLFHSSHIPLGIWLQAVALILFSDGGYPANRLRRTIGGSYKTAWFVEHRIRAALAVGDGSVRPPLGLVTEPGAATWISAWEPTDVAATDVPPNLAVFARLIAGTYKRVSMKYISAYWNEARWRATNDPSHAFRDAVLELLRHPPLTYRQLVDELYPTPPR